MKENKYKSSKYNKTNDLLDGQQQQGQEILGKH